MRTLIPILVIAALAMAACSDATTDAPDLSLTADAARAVMQGAARKQTATTQAQIRVATAEAKATRSALDAMNATATAEARQTAAAVAASTATAQAYAFGLTATADALTQARQVADATATADAQAISLARVRQEATATAQAVTLQTQQAARDADNARRQADFYAVLWPLMTLALIALAVWGAWLFYRQALEARRLRYSILESRAGTVVFVRQSNVTTAQLLLPPGGFERLGPPDYDAPTQAQIARPEVVDTVLIRSAAGETVIAKADAQDTRPEVDRRLALWLLRKSLQIAGPQARQLPTAKQLGWRPETWVRAVALLKPHVTTRQGRSGGTFCAEPFLSISELYAAVGERKIRLGTAPTPLPRADARPEPETMR